jgi:hypothetical protein
LVTSAPTAAARARSSRRSPSASSSPRCSLTSACPPTHPSWRRHELHPSPSCSRICSRAPDSHV